VIATCGRFGIVADRSGKTACGGPPAPQKLCSMGIARRKWVTFHGLALNVTTDLASSGGSIRAVRVVRDDLMATELGEASMVETTRS
jgi:lipoyl(octanoyl) transferase